MIVRETEHEYVMTAQHDHARLSGNVARNFGHFFMNDPFFNDLVFAVYHHDYGWVRLDETPIWDDSRSMPCSNPNYPLLPKLTHYQYGLDQVERRNKYAGLLCSMHYYSFGFQHSTVEECIDFARNEERRQKRIRDELNLTNDEDIIKQFKLLQLCDRISLYVCFNSPGVSKEQEHPSYKLGFEDSELFNIDSEGLLVPEWLNTSEINITPNPFNSSFKTSLRQKRVSKQLVKEIGIAQAYKNGEWVDLEIIFAGRSQFKKSEE